MARGIRHNQRQLGNEVFKVMNGIGGQLVKRFELTRFRQGLRDGMLRQVACCLAAASS